MKKNDKTKPDAETEAPEANTEADAEMDAGAADEAEGAEVEEDADAVAEESEEDAPGEEGDGEEAPADLEAEVADLNDKLLRALAEAENVRRRAQRDKDDTAKYAIAAFARDILSVADNLARAMGAVDADTRKNDAAVDQVMVGLEMTEREMLNTLERFGVKPIEAMGERFDHNLHEAMFEVEDKEKPTGTVVQVMETGYVLNDRLLRPAKVGIAKGGPPADKADKTDAGDGDRGGAPPPPDAAAKEGQTAYEDKGKVPGAELDEEL